MKTTLEIRQEIIEKYKNKEFVIDKSGVKLVEIIGATFLVTEDWIIRKPNRDYIKRELEWYESQSLNVFDIPGETPVIWKQVATPSGYINSNYGWMIWSDENHNQYENVLIELTKNPESRRATMIYQRPSMHYEYNVNGMSDFVCTYANQFFIRNNELVSHYIMRSNDSVFGFCNDVAWAKYVHEKLAKDLDVLVGKLIWTASSLHVYERHFNHIESCMNEIRAS